MTTFNPNATLVESSLYSLGASIDNLLGAPIYNELLAMVTLAAYGVAFGAGLLGFLEARKQLQSSTLAGGVVPPPA